MTAAIDERWREKREDVMASDVRLRRDVLQALATLPLLAAAARPTKRLGKATR